MKNLKIRNFRRISTLAFLSLALIATDSAGAASSKIGILVFDGFLTSDVTAPIEVFGAATKKAWFSSYEVVVILATRSKQVVSEEGLQIIADITIYDEAKLDVLIVPSAYEMEGLLKNEDLGRRRSFARKVLSENQGSIRSERGNRREGHHLERWPRQLPGRVRLAGEIEL